VKFRASTVHDDTQRLVRIGGYHGRVHQVGQTFIESGFAAQLNLFANVATGDNSRQMALRIHDRQKRRPLAVGTGFAERAALRDSRAALRRQIREVAGMRA